MKKIIVTIYLLILSHELLAQAPNILTQTPLGSVGSLLGTSIFTTPDNGYIVAGNGTRGDGNLCTSDGSHATLIKFDSANNIEWKNCYGGTDDAIFNDVKQTADGNYIAVGFTHAGDGDVSGGGYHGLGDVWLVKLSFTGAIIWQKCFGGTDYDDGFQLALTENDSIIVCAYSTSNNDDVSGNHGGGDIWIFKTDPEGNMVWQKTFGGSGSDFSPAMIYTADHKIICGGYTYSNDGDVTGNHGLYDIWICKLTSDGALESAKCYGGSSGDECDAITEKDGYIYAAGNSYSSDGDFTNMNQYYVGAMLMKVDDAGNMVWASFSGGLHTYADFSSLNTAYDGFICTGICGQSNGDVKGNNGRDDYWVCAFNKNGKLNWQRCLGGSDEEYINDAIIKPDNSIVVAGRSDSQDGDVLDHFDFSSIWIVALTPQLYPQVYNNYTNQVYEEYRFLCPGEEFDVPYKISGDFNAGNVFTVQLSKDTTNFSDPVNIGSLQSNVAGSIQAYPPITLDQSVYYQMRVVASAPSAVSNITPLHLFFSCPNPLNLRTINKLVNGATLKWNSTKCTQEYQVRYKIVQGGPYSYVTTADTFLNLTNLQSETEYKWNVRAACVDTGYSVWRNHDIQFITKSHRTESESEIAEPGLFLSPNPASDFTTIEYQLSVATFVNIELFYGNGQSESLLSAYTPAGTYSFETTTKNLPGGIYLVRMTTESCTELRKLLIQ